MIADGVSTVLEGIERRAEREPDSVAFRFDGRAFSFGRLQAGAEAAADRLEAAGLQRDDRVVLTLPNGPEFFDAFYGTQLAGGVAVPIFPGSGPGRVAQLVRLSGAFAVVAPTSLSSDDRAGLEAAVPDVAIVAADPDPRPTATRRPSPAADDLALLQYTSGSTGDPKGVQLTHRHLLTNVRQMVAGMEITENDVFVSWLPVHHDLGLILMTMAPFSVGAELVLLESRLTNVRAWLAAIERHRGTFTAAPDFAYRLCLRAVRAPGAFDLSSLRVALNASEPVRAGTIAEFESRFGLERVMAPAYGLAEATVGVSMVSPGTETIVDDRGFICVGSPFPEVEVRIVEDGHPVDPGVEGDIHVASPANTTGYFDNPEATRRLLRPGGFIDTGDRGYLDDDGRLFVVGRRKNIILTAGRNLAPGELEEIVDLQPEIRASAAVGIDRGAIEGEQAWIFAELRKPSSADEGDRIVIEIVDRLHHRLGLRPARTVLLRPGALPRTANGKLRHSALRESWLRGELQGSDAVLFS